MDKKSEKLPLRNGVGIVLLNGENKVFVAKRIDNPKNFWQMPQGGIDKDESFLDAAKRELKEETSGVAYEIVQVAKMRPNPSTQDNWCYIMKATNVVYSGGQELDEGEDIEFMEMTLNQVKEAIRDGRMSNSLMIAALFSIGEFPS